MRAKKRVEKKKITLAPLLSFFDKVKYDWTKIQLKRRKERRGYIMIIDMERYIQRGKETERDGDIYI
jgi:hypothetical protein